MKGDLFYDWLQQHWLLVIIVYVICIPISVLIWGKHAVKGRKTWLPDKDFKLKHLFHEGVMFVMLISPILVPCAVIGISIFGLGDILRSLKESKIVNKKIF